MTQPITIERVERALDKLAEIIVLLGENGINVLPIYDRLEKEPRGVEVERFPNGRGPRPRRPVKASSAQRPIAITRPVARWKSGTCGHRPAPANRPAWRWLPPDIAARLR